MVSLIVPWALLLLLIITVILLFRKKWIAAGVLAIVVVVLNCWSDCFCFGFKNTFIVKCEAEVNGKTVTLFGCHLSSNNFSSVGNYLTPDEVESASGIKAYYDNILYALHLREMEADTVISYCKNSERVIIMGDMNEVSRGASMRMFVEAGYKDAWSKGGFGYGATIHHPLPYRIDHVLYNQGLKLKGIKRIDTKGISDHDALVAVFDLE